MREKILAMFLVAVMAFSLLSLSACGGAGESPSPDATESPADTASPEPSEAPKPSETPEPSEVPEPSESPEPAVPYAEANGLSFSKEKSYTVPAFTFLWDPTTEEPVSVDGLSITGAVDASYTFGEISASEADGTVQLIIPYHVEFTTAIAVDGSIFRGEDIFYNWTCLTAGMFDYYTGTVIPTDGTLGDTVLENTIDITYQDVTYPIVYTRSMTPNDDYFSDWVNVGGSIDEMQITISSDFTYTISMPKEYDGLCLLLYLPGKTELSEAKEDSSEIGCLLEVIEEAGEDISNYVLMRVSDFM